MGVKFTGASHVPMQWRREAWQPARGLVGRI